MNHNYHSIKLSIIFLIILLTEVWNSDPTVNLGALRTCYFSDRIWQFYLMRFDLSSIQQHTKGARHFRNVSKLVNKSKQLIFKYLIVYTGCTLKLRAVKLLFVIFGRLKLHFFVKIMVLGYGRLSYILWKNGRFLAENGRFRIDFWPEVVQMIFLMTFSRFL